MSNLPRASFDILDPELEKTANGDQSVETMLRNIHTATQEAIERAR